MILSEFVFIHMYISISISLCAVLGGVFLSHASS